MRNSVLSLVILVLCVSAAARADIVLYPIPNTRLACVLQGQVTVHPGRTVTMRHPRFGDLFFDLTNIRYWKVPTTGALASRKLNEAKRSGNVSLCLDAARWALHNGQLAIFYQAAAEAWRLDPNHPTVVRLVAMKKKIDAPIPPSDDLEKEIRLYIKNDERMKVVHSKHFLLLHDTSPDKDPYSKKTRVEERVALLETVYESFLMKFCLEGYSLQVPEKRLKVALFSDRADFLTSSEKDLDFAAGFYTKKDDISVFYDQGTNDLHKVLEALSNVLQEKKQYAIKNRTPNAKDTVRMADTLRVLTLVARENADIEVVSHEATHHMAAATGLFPNKSPVTTWAHEGLATYFESPGEAAWSGIGTVNEDRLDRYRELAADREHCNIRFIISDRIFSKAGTLDALLHGYGQAWALTHFLMNHHFDRLIKYYQLVAAVESEDRLESDEYEHLFAEAFGDDLDSLEAEWRKYMRGLKTDLELITGIR
jgi:hypothetical protein